MHFQIESKKHCTEDYCDVRPTYAWRLVSAAGTLCRSAESFETVAIARGNIADFKRSASGARFAKVEDPQDG